MSKEDKSRVVYGVALLVLGIVSLIFIPMWHIFVVAIWAGLIIELMWRNLTCGRIQALPLSLVLGVNGWFGCATMYHLRTADHGAAKIVIFAVMTIMSDTMAWFAGKHLKWWGEWGDKHPFPNISEKKTNRGFLAGALFSAGAGALSILISSMWIDWGGDIRKMLLTSVLIPVMAPLGDLLESQTKRLLGIKDMSKVLGIGHGGLWDRFDGLVTTFTTWRIVSF